jgi:hypothetical protein
MAEKTQAEIQAMSRAAMDRINAKVDEAINLPEVPTVAIEEASPKMTARAERMARADRWERQITADPKQLPVHHAEANPALLAAQDAAADSLMGNRALRHQSAVNTPAPTAVATATPTELVHVANTPSEGADVAQPVTAESNTHTAASVKPVFEVTSEQIGQTQMASRADISTAEMAQPVILEPTVVTDSEQDTMKQQEVNTHYEPRRTVRRGLYRRRVVGKRGPRRTNDEQAADGFPPSEQH